MHNNVYRFSFDSTVPLMEAELTLNLAVVATQGIYGEARVRTDVAYHVDEPRSVIYIDGTTETGSALVRVFTAFALHMFGPDAFQVRRVNGFGQPIGGPSVLANSGAGLGGKGVSP